jgi:hypothetical protein
MNSIELSARLALDAEYRAGLPKPPNWVLDRLADRALDGGYKIGKGRKNVCPLCFTTRSVNGTCSC